MVTVNICFLITLYSLLSAYILHRQTTNFITMERRVFNRTAEMMERRNRYYVTGITPGFLSG